MKKFVAFQEQLNIFLMAPHVLNFQQMLGTRLEQGSSGFPKSELPLNRGQNNETA